MKEKKFLIARNMLKDKLNIKLISKYNGLNLK